VTTIAVIDGIKIMIFAKDHPPPHLHAKYGEYEAQISLATGDVLKGSLPRAKLRTLQRWFKPRQTRLAFLWTEIQAHRYLGGLMS
jgi:hypothetical protein